ncbi:phage conserved hypothetical protein, C-terminal domain-containing protein [Terrisporobacter glycolicus]|nr:phage conserved hypothetical protein, C-terminal domain-containing protein [Terrisporobacter glycolicus]
MQQGYIKLYRTLIDSDIFKNEKLFKVFIWCLLKATHKERDQVIGRKTIRLKEGQFIFGRLKASSELNMAPSTVWDYMKLLEKHKNINIKSNNKYSIVTIENWSIYQAKENITDNKSNNNADNKSTTNEQQMDTNKNVKNVKNVKNNNIYTRVITRLNEKASKNFKSTTQKTKTSIDARLRDGFIEEDFYKVIEIKTKEWLDTKYEKYLRPETLFGPKFEGYLNQSTNKQVTTKSGVNDSIENIEDINFKPRPQYIEDELEKKRKEYGLL